MSAEKLLKQIVAEQAMKPDYTGQNPYIASGPTHEILVGLQPNGLYQIELLDKQQTEESIAKTIKAFQEYAAVLKSS